MNTKILFLAPLLLAVCTALLIKVQPYPDPLCQNPANPPNQPTVTRGFDTQLACNTWQRNGPGGTIIFDSFSNFQCFPDRVFYLKHATCSSCVGCPTTALFNNTFNECHREGPPGGTPVYFNLLPVHPQSGTVYVGHADGSCGLTSCASNPCQNGGSCTDSTTVFATYTCACATGYEGGNCQTETDECASSPCVHGTCIDAIGEYICTCENGYEGVNCDVDTDECAASPCAHGTCEQGAIGEYICTCDAGYGGVNCDVDLNECASSPCAHGSCTDAVNGYSCTCDAGYSGTNCDVDINECASSPCQHDGVCTTPVVASFHCSCAHGYSGVFCEIHPGDKDKDKNGDDDDGHGDD